MYEADGLYSKDDIANNRIIPLEDQVPGEGMIRYVDQDGNKIINSKDRTVVGNDVPNFTYGFNLDINYKKFTLSVLGQGVANVKVYLENEASQAFF